MRKAPEARIIAVSMLLLLVATTGIAFADASADLELTEKAVSSGYIRYSITLTNGDSATYGVVKISLHNTDRCVAEDNEEPVEHMIAECSGALGTDSGNAICIYPPVSAGSRLFEEGEKLSFNLRIIAREGVDFGTYYVHARFVTPDGTVLKKCEPFAVNAVTEEIGVPVDFSIFGIFLVSFFMLYFLVIRPRQKNK